jgi:hypothetical protein
MAHPRRVYFFLTTVPRQPIPEFSSNPTTFKKMPSPSISSSFEEEEVEERKRDVLSPSPEVDLAGPPHEDSHIHAIADLTFPMDDFKFEEDNDLARITSNRAPSPPLEQDEKEFTQTASMMQQRKASEHAEYLHMMESLDKERSISPSSFAPPSLSMSVDSLDSISLPEEEEEEFTEEKMLLRNQEAAAMLFGAGHVMTMMDFSTHSPMLKPQRVLSVEMTPRKDSLLTLHTNLADVEERWTDLKSPEAIGLSELDDMLGAFA